MTADTGHWQRRVTPQTNGERQQDSQAGMEKDGEEGLTTNWPEGTAKIGGVGMKQKVTDHGIGRSTDWKEQKHK